jgi:hypothetical protein
MKPHSSIQVVRKWRGMCAIPILRCLDDSEWLNNRYLPSKRSPQVRELANGLRHGTAMPSQDMSGAWVTIWG